MNDSPAPAISVFPYYIVRFKPEVVSDFEDDYYEFPYYIVRFKHGSTVAEKFEDKSFHTT